MTDKSLALVLAVAGAAFAILTAAAIPLDIPDTSFEGAKGGKSSVWECSKNFHVDRSAGHNGSGGMVWESAEPTKRQDFARQVITLKPGKAYSFSALVRTEKLKSKKNGAALCIEWHRPDGKWWAGAYVKGILAGNQDWTLIRGVTREIPAEATKIVLMLYLTAGSSGKACFDNVCVEPVERPPVAFVFSSAYRNVAVDGDVRFNASLYPPEDETNVRAVFAYRAADGQVRRVPATSETRDGATLALKVSDLAEGRSEVACELVSSAGKALGRASCTFERVAELPKRRVWIDAHKRCIVDGKPFFPLGMYSGRLTPEQLELYAKGPFNVVMPYARANWQDLNALHAKGIMGFVSLRSEILGTDWARKNNVTTQEQVDEYFISEINKVKNHPAVLGWYVNDERPATEIPVRTHLRGVFERTDPDHPTWAVLDRTYDLREFIPTFDVLGMDPYPVALKPLRHITDMMREVKRCVFSDVALWNVPQTFNWGWYRKNEAAVQHFPTEEEIANMNWQHIAHGANGLVSYCFHGLFRDAKAEERAELWERVCRANEPVKRMIPVLLSVESAPAVTGAPETLPTRVWAKDGALYVLAVNVAGEPLAASLEIAGAAGWTVSSVEVGRAERAEVTGTTLALKLGKDAVALLKLVR